MLMRRLPGALGLCPRPPVRSDARHGAVVGHRHGPRGHAAARRRQAHGLRPCDRRRGAAAARRATCTARPTTRSPRPRPSSPSSRRPRIYIYIYIYIYIWRRTGRRRDVGTRAPLPHGTRQAQPGPDRRCRPPTRPTRPVCGAPQTRPPPRAPYEDVRHGTPGANGPAAAHARLAAAAARPCGTTWRSLHPLHHPSRPPRHPLPVHTHTEDARRLAPERALHGEQPSHRRNERRRRRAPGQPARRQHDHAARQALPRPDARVGALRRRARLDLGDAARAYAPARADHDVVAGYHVTRRPRARGASPQGSSPTPRCTPRTCCAPTTRSSTAPTAPCSSSTTTTTARSTRGATQFTWIVRATRSCRGASSLESARRVAEGPRRARPAAAHAGAASSGRQRTLRKGSPVYIQIPWHGSRDPGGLAHGALSHCCPRVYGRA